MDRLNEEKIAALKLARQILVCEQDNYICYALDRIGNESLKLGLACLFLKRYIQEALAGEVSLGAWQASRGILEGDYTSGKIRKDRIDWIDWMIKCLLEDGK